MSYPLIRPLGSMPSPLRHPVALLGACLLAATGLRAVETPNYETQIRPILKEHCTHCHGEEDKPKGGIDLRLRRTMDAKTEDGQPVLTPGHPDQSAMLKLIRAGEMPKKGKKMPEAQVALLESWIKAGAKINETEPSGVIPPGVYVSASDRKFWSFQPVTKPTIPHFADAPDLSPIDAFIRTKLKAKQLDFAPEADRATLIRRVTLDLTGLPPTPTEAAAFVADTSPDAYAKLIDRLLASTAYGERWARHWLDVAGYADTNGYADADSVRPYAWHYRDYVIRSLNADKPWNQFIQEQLAGDELNAVTSTTVATAVLDPSKIDDGRDHNHTGYTTWFAGAGVKPGFSFGETDEFGYESVVDPVHIHDWHATILHLLGLEHTKLTYRYAGRDMRLTEVKGNVVKGILA